MKATLAVMAIALLCRAAQSAQQPGVNALWVYSVTPLPDPVTDGPTRGALIQNGSASPHFSSISPTLSPETRLLTC
jgi:hypothetical protein